MCHVMFGGSCSSTRNRPAPLAILVEELLSNGICLQRMGHVTMSRDTCPPATHETFKKPATRGAVLRSLAPLIACFTCLLFRSDSGDPCFGSGRRDLHCGGGGQDGAGELDGGSDCCGQGSSDAGAPFSAKELHMVRLPRPPP